MTDLLDEWEISLSEIISSEGLKCVSLIDDAVEHILENEERQARKGTQSFKGLIRRLKQGILKRHQKNTKPAKY